MLSLLSQFQKISPCSFLSRGRFIPILVLFLKILLKNMEASIVQKRIRWHIIFHHELSSNAMLRLLSKFQKISPCSFLSRGRFIPILAHFLKISLKNIEAFIVQKRIRWHFFHHEFSYVKFIIKISKDFLCGGRFVPILVLFLKISLKNTEAFMAQNRIRWYILFSSWIIFLCNV